MADYPSPHPDYEIIRELGRGGMGVVYLAHNKIMGRDEVLKALDKDFIEQAAMQDRFLREIRAVARLRHPNIVAAYSAFRSGESLVFAMEYVEGLDLARMVKAKGPIPVGHACYFVYQAALALEHAREEGLVHRDIKPGNLMLTHAKGRALIKVLDFGLAKANRETQSLDHRRADGTRAAAPDEQLTLDGQILGTPEFIAPEQIADAQNADIRADIYSLGCTLYYLLSGHPPFPKKGLIAVMEAHRTQTAAPLDLACPDVSAKLAAVVARMMEKQPDRRFQTPAEVARALTPFFKSRDEASARTVPGSSPSVTPDLDRRQLDAIWEKLIDFEDTEGDSSGIHTDARPITRRRAMVTGAAGIAAVLLLAGMIVFATRLNRVSVMAHRESGRTDFVDNNHRTGTSDIKRKPAQTVPAGQERTSPSAATSAEENVPSPVPMPFPAQPATVESTGRDRQKSLSKPVASFMAHLIKARRWDWIHDAHMPAFDRWVESLRARGYRPFFANGHDLAPQIKVNGEPDNAGQVRMAAIAVKDDRPVAFQVALDHTEKGFPHYLEITARGYKLTAMTTFTNGTVPLVLAIYNESNIGASFCTLSPSDFPGQHVSEWLGLGLRPFSASCRAVGDFWEINVATKKSNGIDWTLHSELSRNELDRVLVQAKAKGFRPDSLFVCPGKARGGFGVVLTHDDPALLWEVHPNLTSAELDSDVARMAETGYSPDQVVGYSLDGASRYVVCWSRSPVHYPATGLTDQTLEPLDIALEQFLVEHHIPTATMAVFRNGRLAMSRGFGHVDEKTQTPVSPSAAMPLADLSNPLAAAAVYSLIRKKKLSEVARLSELLGPPDGAAMKSRPTDSGSEPTLTLVWLLGRLGDSMAKFDERGRGALSAFAAGATDGTTGPVPMTDPELYGALLGRILETATSKSASDAIALELSQIVRLARAVTSDLPAKKPQGLVPLFGSAMEVGRFFLKNQFDGRPLPSRVKPKAGALIGRRGRSLAILERRGDLLVVVMLTVPESASAELGDALCSRLEEAVDSLEPTPAAAGKRKSSSR